MAYLRNKIKEVNESADDLDGYTSDDAPMSQKIPDSQVKMNTELFGANHPNGQAPSADQGTGRKQSPFADRAGVSHKKASGFSHSNNDNVEALKKMIYNKSPKEIASEYLHSSRQQSQSQSHQKSKSNHSPQRTKNHPFPFNSGHTAEKEHPRRIDEENENFNVSSNLQKGQTKPSAYTEMSNKLFTQKMYNSSQAKKTALTSSDDAGYLLSPTVAQQIENRREKASKSAQQEHAERLIEIGKIMSEHNKALVEAYLQKEMEECTFAPRIHTVSSTRPLRTTEEFYDEQNRFVQKVEEKRKKMQEDSLQKQIANEGPYKPEVCKGSLKILEKKKKPEMDMSVHHRLYKVGRNSHAKHLQDLAEKEHSIDDGASDTSSQFIGPISAKTGFHGKHTNSHDDITFKPTIHKRSQNLKRHQKIEDILYSDATRRKQKSVESSKMKTKTDSKIMSSSSQRALATRLIKEFDLAIVEFLEADKPPKLDYLQLNEFLRKMRFLRESEQVDSPHFTPERILLYDMWYILRADKYKGVHRRNLLVFLLAVLGLHYQITKIQKPEDPSEASINEADNLNPAAPELSGQRERKEVGTFDEDGNYELKEEDVRKIRKMYELWHINRMCSGDNIGQLISSRKIEEPNYQPEINEASRDIAHNYRKKILSGTVDLIQQNKVVPPKDGKITHVDLLILSKKVVQEKIEKKAEAIKEKEVEGCTFKPQTIDYIAEGKTDSHLESSTEHPRKANAMPPNALGKNRAFELYSLAKPRTLKKDKDKNEVEYEKFCDECTFQPNITNTRNSRVHAKPPTEFYAKGVDKTIDRLRSARAEKEHQMMLMERGFSTGNEPAFVFSVDKQQYRTNASIEKVTRKLTTEPDTSVKLDGSGHYSNERIDNHIEENPRKSRTVASNHQGSNIKDDTGDHEADYDKYNPTKSPYEEKEAEEEQIEENEDKGEEQGEENNEENPEEEGADGENERVPLLFVDVNLGAGRAERIVVYEGDKSEDLAHRFAEEHGRVRRLDGSMKVKLKELLDSQIAGLLSRIDEEVNSGHSETDRHNHSGHYGNDQIQEEEDLAEEGSYRKSKK